MNRGYLLLVVLLMFSLAAAEEPKPPTDEEIREAKVYEAIADMISRRDKLLAGKFAVVMHGESMVLGYPGGPIQMPHVYGRVIDGSRSFDLKFGYSVSSGKYESGAEVVREGTKYKMRENSNLFATDYIEKPAKEPLSKWRPDHYAYGLDPYDDYLTGANAFMSGITHRQIEMQVLKTYKLLSTERTLGDRLVSRWSCIPIKGLDARIRMEFDPAFEMMLVRHSLENLDNKNDFQETRIQWTRQGKSLVPSRIEIGRGSMGNSGQTSEITFKCRWLFGDEVPDTIFTAKDHLAALMDHLKIPHATVVNGERIDVMHVLPEDLYEDKRK